MSQIPLILKWRYPHAHSLQVQSHLVHPTGRHPLSGRTPPSAGWPPSRILVAYKQDTLHGGLKCHVRHVLHVRTGLWSRWRPLPRLGSQFSHTPPSKGKVLQVVVVFKQLYSICFFFRCWDESSDTQNWLIVEAATLTNVIFLLIASFHIFLDDSFSYFNCNPMMFWFRYCAERQMVPIAREKLELDGVGIPISFNSFPFSSARFWMGTVHTI